MTGEPSVASRRLYRFMSVVVRPVFGVVTPTPRNVRWLRGFVARVLAMKPDAGTVVTPGPAGEWVRGPGVAEGGPSAILYLHGSAYVVCSPATHRALVARLSREACVPAYSVDYRLAPEHLFPAAFDDAVTSYRYLMDNGYAAEQVVVAADSAGGHLALALVAGLHERGLPTPAGLVLFSPLVDPTWDTAEQREHEIRDPLANARVGRRLTELYCRHVDRHDPRLDVLAGDAARMPPVYVQVGEHEILCADAQALETWLRGAGVSCTTTTWPGQIHVFQAWFRRVPEAACALREAGAFIRELLPTAKHDPTGHEYAV